MRTKPALLVTALLAALVAGAAPARAEVQVVTSVPTLAALVRAVGGGHVRVTSMALPTQDPHFVDAKPSLALSLNKADLLVVVGLDLEVGWLPTLQTGARNPAIQRGGSGYLDCSVYAAKKDVPTTKVDRSMGDIHPGGNPHYLYDPRAARGCAAAIAARLAILDPGHARAYRAGLAAFDEDLEKRMAAWDRALAPHKGKGVVTYHRSWIYLLDWTGLTEVATLEPKPGIPPSARHVASVIKAARGAGARVILQESYYPDKTARLVAQKIGGTLLALQAGPSASQAYLDHIDAMIQAIVAALAR